jgi:meso-butanediol dehydrogenase/(S,S)-butanediol dehydrogenase/diacetyl reductase
MDPLAVAAGTYDVWSGRFRDRVVVVTGAASGIGAAAARRFWTEGARVVLADLDDDGLRHLGATLSGDRCVTRVVDVADPEQVDALIDAAIEAFGRLDVVVNNAGIAISGPLAEATSADWNRVMSVNAGGVFNGCRAAVGHLIRTRGNIVNTASVSGLGGDWNLSMYNASKGAVVNLTRALALDLGRHGVRVNAVCPTVTLTGMSAGIERDEA